MLKRRILTALLMLSMIALAVPCYAFADVMQNDLADIEEIESPDTEQSTEIDISASQDEMASDGCDNQNIEQEELSELSNSADPYVLASENAGTVADGVYLIRMAKSSGQVLDAAGVAPVRGANVSIWASNMGANQRWSITHDADGFVTLRPLSSPDLVLDAAGPVPANGSNVSVWTDNGGLNQKWIAVSQGSSIRLVSAGNTAFSLDITGANAANGSNATVWLSNASGAQDFVLINTDVQVPACEDLGLTGYYSVRPKSGPAYVLDAAGALPAAGANVSAWSSNGGSNQLWTFDYGDGYYRITNAASGRVLSAADGNLVPGTNVCVENPVDGAARQEWVVTGSDAEGYAIRNRANGLVLDIAGAFATLGANASTWHANGTTNQLFDLESKGDSLLEDGSYYVVASAMKSSLVLDVAGNSRTDGANVNLWSSNNGLNQRWKVGIVGDDVYTFQSLVSGMYLSASGDNTVQAATVSDAAKWRLIVTQGGPVLQNVADGRALNIMGTSIAQGANIGLMAGDSASTQKLLFTSVGAVADGYYFIEASSNADQVVEVTGNSTTSGTNVESYRKNDGTNQRWNFKRNADGTYTILCDGSDLALGVSGDAPGSGSNVQQLTPNGSAAQKWNIDFEGGLFRISSAVDCSLVLSIAGTPASGVNVVIASENSTYCQSFIMEKTVSGMPTPYERSLLARAQNYSSPSGYLILIDCTNNWLTVLTGSRGNWSIKYLWKCGTGAWDMPTVIGTFHVIGHVAHFGEEKGYTVWDATRFYGEYYIHSILYYPYSHTEIFDGNYGNVSHGCIRLAPERANWIYHNIPMGTTVVTFR